MTRDETPDRDAMTDRLLAAWETADYVGNYSVWRDGDRVAVYFDGELPDTLYETDIGGGGTYRFVTVNARGPTPSVTVEIRRYPTDPAFTDGRADSTSDPEGGEYTAPFVEVVCRGCQDTIVTLPVDVDDIAAEAYCMDCRRGDA